MRLMLESFACFSFFPSHRNVTNSNNLILKFENERFNPFETKNKKSTQRLDCSSCTVVFILSCCLLNNKK